MTRDEFVAALEALAAEVDDDLAQSMADEPKSEPWSPGGVWLAVTKLFSRDKANHPKRGARMALRVSIDAIVEPVNYSYE